MVDADDTADFDAKLESVVSKWRKCDCTSTSDMEGFVAWFTTYKAPVIRNSMIRPVREECGLGSPPAQFTTNAAETANYMLKHKVDYKRSQLPEFLQKFQDLVKEQEREVEKSLIGRGKFELRKQYQSWYVPETKWFTMTTAQRENHIKRFSDASLSDVTGDGNTEDDIPHISLGRGPSVSSTLSVKFETFADDVRIPSNSLEGIWKKASELLNTDNAIVPAPGGGVNAKLVLSYRGTRPHLVAPKKGGGFVCDSDCPNWKALNICAHSVAVAELCHKLPEFVEQFKKSKKPPSLTKFADVTMPKGRGNKGNAASRKRKVSTPIETRVDNPLWSSASGEELPTLSVSQTNSVQLPVQASSQPVQCNTVQYGTDTPAWSFPSTQFSPSPVWPPYDPSLGSPPYFYQRYPPPSSSYVSPSPTPFPQPFPPHPSSPFSLCKLGGNISVCAGCRNKYSKSAGPPEDMCIKHQEWREYTSPGSQVPARRYGNTYYHFDPKCVWHRCPAFVPAQLQIPPDIIPQLGEIHKAKLRMLFSINLP